MNISRSYVCLHGQPSVSGEVMVSPSYLSWWHCNYGENLPPWNETIDIPEADEASCEWTLWPGADSSVGEVTLYSEFTDVSHIPYTHPQFVYMRLNHRLPTLILPCAKGDGVDEDRWGVSLRIHSGMFIITSNRFRDRVSERHSRVRGERGRFSESNQPTARGKAFKPRQRTLMKITTIETIRDFWRV